MGKKAYFKSLAFRTPDWFRKRKPKTISKTSKKPKKQKYLTIF